MRNRLFATALFLLSCLLTSAQPLTQKRDQKDTSATAQKDQSEAVRISVTLVQVDAVVTDANGRPVTNLKPEDFEILEDGRRQHITNFSYVTTGSDSTPPAAKPEARSNIKPPIGPPPRLRPDQVQRSTALVVDDLGLSAESIAAVRAGLKKFVDEQMQPTDLVAIIRTGAGMGALQLFTSDKRRLYAAIDRIRWNPMGTGGLSAFAQLSANLIPPGSLESRSASGRDSVDEFRQELSSGGSVAALRYIVQGLRDLPGRKSVILFSDGFRLRTNGMSGQVLESLRSLIDLATRSSVVFYALDARGLQWTGLTAADSIGSRRPNQISQVTSSRSNHIWQTQEGPSFLAQETGGFLIHNTNNLGDGIKRVMDDQKGYYLLGYVPEETTFKLEKGTRKFHKIAVNVKVSGLKVRSHTGFYGVPNEEVKPSPRTPQAQVLAALTSPFGASDIGLKLTSLFAYDAKAGPFMRSLLHIDARDLKFTNEPDGSHKAVVNVVAVTFGDNGQVVDEEGQTYTVQTRDEDYQRLLEHGFLYTLNVLVKKPGAYQLRAAVRDASTERVGSATQFIEVPDVGRNQLTLSGIVLSGTDPKTSKNPPGETIQSGKPATIDKSGAVEESDPMSGPAVRNFRTGMNLEYGLLIYNARRESKSNLTQLESQFLLFRDGKQVFASKVRPVDADARQDSPHIRTSGRFPLESNLEPGEYVLQIVVTDKLAKDKSRSAMQWIDFEIAK